MALRVPSKSIGLKETVTPTTSRTWVRGLFADYAFVALSVYWTLDFDGGLRRRLGEVERSWL